MTLWLSFKKAMKTVQSGKGIKLIRTFMRNLSIAVMMAYFPLHFPEIPLLGQNDTVAYET